MSRTRPPRAHTTAVADSVADRWALRTSFRKEVFGKVPNNHSGWGTGATVAREKAGSKRGAGKEKAAPQAKKSAEGGKPKAAATKAKTTAKAAKKPAKADGVREGSISKLHCPGLIRRSVPPTEFNSQKLPPQLPPQLPPNTPRIAGFSTDNPTQSKRLMSPLLPPEQKVGRSNRPGRTTNSCIISHLLDGGRLLLCQNCIKTPPGPTLYQNFRLARFFGAVIFVDGR